MKHWLAAAAGDGMTGPGYKQTSSRQNFRSALPPGADFQGGIAVVPFVALCRLEWVRLLAAQLLLHTVYVSKYP